MFVDPDAETEINTSYTFHVEGIEVNFNDSWCPGATISLYERGELLFTRIDCPQVLHWTPPSRRRLRHSGVVGIEYWEDGYMCQEELVTEEEADEIASRAAYDGRDEAHIAVTRTFSVGTSTLRFKVERTLFYDPAMYLDVSLCVEFASSEECTRFLHEDMRKLEDRDIRAMPSDVAVINDIMRALDPFHDDVLTAFRNAIRRSIPFSQFVDECPQPEMQVIRHRASNRGDDRPCFLTLHLSTNSFYVITSVDWSATTIPPTFPSPSGAFRSLNNIHFNFPSSTPHDDCPSQNSADPLTFTVRYAASILIKPQGNVTTCDHNVSKGCRRHADLSAKAREIISMQSA